MSKETNTKLIKSLKEIINDLSSENVGYEEDIYMKLKKDLSPELSLLHENWKAPRYKEFRNRSNTYNFNFLDLDDIIFKGKVVNTMLIYQPNGKQKWPDILFIKDKIGFPIEVKTGKNDKIVWNGGLPVSDTLYIYNNYNLKVATCFLGQHSLSDARRFSLKSQQEVFKKNAKVQNELDKSSNSDEGWLLYPRAMFNDSNKYISDEVLKAQRELETFNYIETLTWNSSQVSNFSTKVEVPESEEALVG